MIPAQVAVDASAPAHRVVSPPLKGISVDHRRPNVSTSVVPMTPLEKRIADRQAETAEAIRNSKGTKTRDDFEGEVECPHCGDFMEVDIVISGTWQCTCSQCGAAGPRARSEYKALAFAALLFS